MAPDQSVCREHLIGFGGDRHRIGSHQLTDWELGGRCEQTLDGKDPHDRPALQHDHVLGRLEPVPHEPATDIAGKFVRSRRRHVGRGVPGGNARAGARKRFGCLWHAHILVAPSEGWIGHAGAARARR